LPEVIGTPETPAKKKKLPKPRGGFVKGSATPYAPDDPNTGVFKDFEISTDEYIRRFNGRAQYTKENTDGRIQESFVPGVDATVQSPVLFREGGRFHYRWRPVRIQSMDDYQGYLQSGTGKAKRALESSGNAFDFDGGGRGGSQFYTHTLGPADQLIGNEFVPFMNGPFYKQLYQYDYLLMHSRAFQLVNHAALAAGAVKIMTRFVLGRGISFSIKNSAAQKIWDEFWEANHMRNAIRQMARDLCWQGELMLRFYEREPGRLTMRIIDPSTCWEVVTDPEDFEHVYYYHFQWPCLRGDVKISGLDGQEITIADLAQKEISEENPFWVYSYDEDSGKVVPGKATRCWKAGVKRCVEVELDNGEKVVSSWDHPFLRRDGQYVHAEDLKPGDSLMPLYRRSGYEQVWHPGPDVLGHPRNGRWDDTHRLVAAEAAGRKIEKGEVAHHLNDKRADNRPDNLAIMNKKVHDAETGRSRWKNPELADWRDQYLKKMEIVAKQAWKDGKYHMLVGKGSRKDRQEWREGISSGVSASWKDPEVKAARNAWRKDPEKVAAAREKASKTRADRKEAAPNNHKVVAVRRVGDHTVYDLQVEKYHNFALSAGVFTHNTPYQTWVQGNIPISKYIIQEVPPTNVQHIKINISSQEKRGRSDLLPAMPWLKRFDDYYNGAVMKAILEANLVYKIKIHGDQNDIDSMSTDSAFTIMPPPGGTWLENDAVDMTPLSAVMTAGRGSAGIGQQIASIVATSLNLPTEYFNIEGGAGGARATALVRTDPAVKAVEDRQQILRESLEDTYDRVMEAAIREGRLSLDDIKGDPTVLPDDGQVDDEKSQDKNLPFGGSSHSPVKAPPVQAQPINRVQSFPGRATRASIRG
jgi:intein/homing endonuclease